MQHPTRLPSTMGATRSSAAAAAAAEGTISPSCSTVRRRGRIAVCVSLAQHTAPADCASGSQQQAVQHSCQGKAAGSRHICRQQRRRRQQQQQQQAPQKIQAGSSDTAHAGILRQQQQQQQCQPGWHCVTATSWSEHVTRQHNQQQQQQPPAAVRVSNSL